MKLWSLQRNKKTWPIHSRNQQKLSLRKQILNLLDKDFMLPVFKELKEDMRKELKERKITSNQIEKINEEMEIIKGNQTEILELMSIIAEMKSLLEGSNWRSEQDRIKNEWTWRQVSWNYPVWDQIGEKNEEKWQSLREFWDIVKHINTHIMGVPPKRGENQRARKNIWRNSDQKLDKFEKTHGTPHLKISVTSKRIRLNHIIIKLSKSQVKRESWKQQERSDSPPSSETSIRLRTDSHEKPW